MKLSQRQELIIKLISENVVETQDDILALLKANGVDTTQATVSRDVKKLNLFKALDSNGNYRYLLGNADKPDDANEALLIRSSVLSVDYALNNVVVKCRTGMANAACATIDKLRHGLIVGTIAGDDTILIITRSTEASEELCEYFNEFIGK